MANPENLGPPFDGTKPGPGRPKGSVSLVVSLKNYLEKNPKDIDLIVRKVIKDAQEGDVQARKLIFDRIDGPVQQAIDHTSGGQPIKALIGINIDEDI